MDAETLMRIQFGCSMACHILFPTITIGLAWLLAYAEWRWRRSGEAHWLALYRYWAPLFAASFLLGIVTGLIQGMQLAVRFERLNQLAGPILTPLRWAEGWLPLAVELLAIGIMLFGWRRPGPRWHFAATLFLALALTNAAVWILCANSWMQTPQGMRWGGDRWLPQDWRAIVFNPSFLPRLAHMLIAALLSTALVVGAVSAAQWRRARSAAARHGLRTSVAALAVLATVQVFAGHASGLVAARHQPAKFAAMEGLWRGGGDQPFVLIGVPDAQAMRNRHALEIPHLGSLLLGRENDGRVRGLAEFGARDRPPVAPAFFGFRAMVALGCWLLGMGLYGAWQLGRGRLEHSPRFLRLLVVSWPLGFAATLAGWTVTETGRQPWLIYGLLRTADGITPGLPASEVAASLRLMGITYVLLLGFYACLVRRLLQRDLAVLEQAEKSDVGTTADVPAGEPDPELQT